MKAFWSFTSPSPCKNNMVWVKKWLNKWAAGDLCGISQFFYDVYSSEITHHTSRRGVICGSLIKTLFNLDSKCHGEGKTHGLWLIKNMFFFQYSELVSSFQTFHALLFPSPPPPCCFCCLASFKCYKLPFHGLWRGTPFGSFECLGSKPGYHRPRRIIDVWSASLLLKWWKDVLLGQYTKLLPPPPKKKKK